MILDPNELSALQKEIAGGVREVVRAMASDAPDPPPVVFDLAARVLVDLNRVASALEGIEMYMRDYAERNRR